MTTSDTPEQITHIPLEQLHESPFNPRKTFTDITALAASIQAEGRIHQPLLVRPRIVNPLSDEQAGFEIVFGHRRYRAAEQLGLASVPCMVRAMTDAEARSAQTVENLQRVDVHPIEEAEGFKALMELDGLSADEIASRVGKSRSHVYGRLKLLQACTPVRAACLAGEIGSEVALLIARLRTEKLQTKALNDISGKFIDLRDGGKKSYRQIRDLLNERYALTLARPYIFDPEDATLVPEAGACTTCPKLSGNAPEFADIVEGQTEGRGYTGHMRHTGGNVCTDPDCFAAKKVAIFERQAQALRDQGQEVVAGSKARAALTATGDVKGAYVALDQVKAALKKAKVKLPTVTIQNPRNGKTVQAVRAADLQGAGIATQPAAPLAHRASKASQDYEAAERERAEKVNAENIKRRALLVRVRQAAAGRARSTDELRVVLKYLLGALPEDDLQTLASLHGRDALHDAAIDAMGADALALLLLDLVLVQDVELAPWNLSREPEALHDMAALYGIDPTADPDEAGAVQASEPPDPAPTPSTAARAPAKAARGAGAVKYRDPATGSTWSGKGLQPRWLKAALEDGATLEQFQTDNGSGAAVAEPAEAAA